MDGLISKLRSLDAYPKINEDFYSRTLSGGVITLVSSIVMILLFTSELRASSFPVFPMPFVFAYSCSYSVINFMVLQSVSFVFFSVLLDMHTNEIFFFSVNELKSMDACVSRVQLCNSCICWIGICGIVIDGVRLSFFFLIGGIMVFPAKKKGLCLLMVDFCYSGLSHVARADFFFFFG